MGLTKAVELDDTLVTRVSMEYGLRAEAELSSISLKFSVSRVSSWAMGVPRSLERSPRAGGSRTVR